MEFLRSGSIRVLENMAKKREQSTKLQHSSSSDAATILEAQSLLDGIQEEAQFFGFENLLRKYFLVAPCKYVFESSNSNVITQPSNGWMTYKVTPYIGQVPAKICFAVSSKNANDDNTWKFIVGVIDCSEQCDNSKWLGSSATGFGYCAAGVFVHKAAYDVTYGTKYGLNDKIEVCIAADYTLSFALNGVQFGAVPAKLQPIGAAPLYAFAVSLSGPHTLTIV